MKIKDPEVTLADEARSGVQEDVHSGFLDWLFQFSVTGEDGQHYAIGGSILSMALEKLDVVSFTCARGEGGTEQLPGSIDRVTRFPGMLCERLLRKPQGSLRIRREEYRAVVTCGEEYRVECLADHTWRLRIDSLDGAYRAELTHWPKGYPLWYGREKPSHLTQHSVTCGYNWAGDVEGVITLAGQDIRVRGRGIRERYVAVDSSAAELGGWEDWGWIAFDQIHTSLYDMRLGMKDFSLYDLETRTHYPEGTLTIQHEDWAFMRELDGFIPCTYRIRMAVEGGALEARARVCNATTWGVTFQVPDYPVATLTFGEVEGTFTTAGGTVRRLTGGRGALSVRQWHAYPSVLPRELYTDDARTGERFDTL